MKKLSLITIAFIMTLSLVACGGGGTDAPVENNSDANLTNSTSSNMDDSQTALPNSNADADSETVGKNSDIISTPTFTGDAVQFLGLGSEDACDLLGDGSQVTGTAPSASKLTPTIVSNKKNGAEITLTNSAENLNVYSVYKVTLRSDEGVHFSGIKVGDTLKNVDKILMDGGATYSGSLRWILFVGEDGYDVQLATSDDKTVSSITAEAYPKSKSEFDKTNAQLLESNSFAYTQDMHEFEPIYWE